LHPFLIDFGTVSLPLFGPVRLALPSYGLMLAIGTLCGWIWYHREARRHGLDQDSAAAVLFWSIVAALAGGKLGLVLVEPGYYLGDPSRMLTADFLRAGGVVWAAVLAGIGTLILLCLRWKLPVATVLDCAALPIPLVQAIGRVGCLLAGCCYGAACDLPWGVVYHSAEGHERTGVPLGVPLHPAPLYESAWNLAIVLPVLLWVRRHQRFPGEVMLAYLTCYSVGRALVEFFRGDGARGLWFGGLLSSGQLVSLVVFPVAAGLWLALRQRTGRDPGAAGAP
jgi:phosphatidylglycerol:prolipoprotein diacylglycerol transferase